MLIANMTETERKSLAPVKSNKITEELEYEISNKNKKKNTENKKKIFF